MEILGLEEIFKNADEKGKVPFSEFAEKMSKQMGVDLDTFTKAAILSALSVGKIDLYKRMKKMYLEGVVEQIQNKKLSDFTDKKDLERIRMMEEFELEIQQTRLMCVNKKLEGLK